MKVDYLSLTQAISYFERHKIKNMEIKVVEEGSNLNSITIHGKNYVKKFCPLFEFIKNEIPIYGKKYPDDRYSELKKIPLSITSKLIDNETLEIFGDSKVWTLEPIPKYIIFNRYDYNDYYNPSTNYDALKELKGKIIYTDISVKQSEFIEFIKFYEKHPLNIYDTSSFQLNLKKMNQY